MINPTKQDATKVVLGGKVQSGGEVTSKKGSIAAGLLVKVNSSDVISVSSGGALGISLGADLSDAGFTSICRKGLKVPILLTAEFTPSIGAQVNISDTTGLAIASGGGATAYNAVYVSGVLTGVKEDGTTANVALIDFAGGL